jgi:hypothetical protein
MAATTASQSYQGPSATSASSQRKQRKNNNRTTPDERLNAAIDCEYCIGVLLPAVYISTLSLSDKLPEPVASLLDFYITLGQTTAIIVCDT